jgi:hypothetical protein
MKLSLKLTAQSVAVALWATRSAHEWVIMVTLRQAKRLQRIVAGHICNVIGCICRNQSTGLRERCKIFREQARQWDISNAKWPDNFRALR